MRDFELCSADQPASVRIAASVSKSLAVDGSREEQKSACNELLAEVLQRDFGVTSEREVGDGWTVEKSESGAPRLFLNGQLSKIHLSMAHSGPWVAVAAAVGARVGIDVEQIKPRGNFAEMAKYMGWADKVDDLDSFLSRWTLWEACVKLEESSIFKTTNTAFEALGSTQFEQGFSEVGSWAGLRHYLPEGAFFALAMHQDGDQALEVKR